MACGWLSGGGGTPEGRRHRTGLHRREGRRSQSVRRIPGDTRCVPVRDQISPCFGIAFRRQRFGTGSHGRGLRHPGSRHLRRIRPRHLGPEAHAIGSDHCARRHYPRRGSPGDGGAHAPAGSGMKELLRLLAYARRYTGHLLGAVVLMTLAGASTGMMALLIGPILYRVLDVHAADGPVALYTDPIFHHTLYLNDFFPRSFHNVWTMMAFAILGVFFLKGLCDYFGNYLVNYAGFSAVTNLRNTVFDKVLKQGAEFFESHSTGRLMSSIMNDIEKVQLATSHILADFLRQLFMAVFLAAVVLGKDPKLALL